MCLHCGQTTQYSPKVRDPFTSTFHCVILIIPEHINDVKKVLTTQLYQYFNIPTDEHVDSLDCDLILLVEWL